MRAPFLRQLLFVLCVGLLLAGCTAASQVGSDDPSPALPAGEPRSALPTVTPGQAPTVALTTLEGAEVTLAQWQGQGIVLNFWATWCYPCRTEMPALAAFHQEQSDIVVIGVNYQESAELAKPFVEELGLSFPILLDEQGLLSKALGVRGLPTTYFINASGEVVGSHTGPLTQQALEDIVLRLSLP